MTRSCCLSQAVATLLALTACVSAVSDSVADYAPSINGPCPSEPIVRTFTPQNQSLNSAEAEYISTRSSEVLPDAWRDWLGDATGIGYNQSLIDTLSASGNWSKVGIAISGGGYRAAQFGAGVLSGLDARNESAKDAGTGGLLQVTSYLSALSGGSWLTGSLYMNEFPTIADMVYGNGGNLSGWLLDLDLALPGGDDVFDDQNQAFFGSLLWSVEAKAAQGLDTSLTDPWARMISYHFLNQTTRSNFFTNDSAHGAGQLWSQIPTTAAYQSHQVPLPIIMADSRPIGDNSTGKLSPDAVVYEISPYEFGSWDPNLSSMMNLTYVGTPMNDGNPPNGSACVTGFDQAGFVMGTSASLFNQIFDGGTNKLTGFGEKDASGLTYVLAWQLREVRTRANDVANWPNPFQGLKSSTFQDSDSDWLELVDGSTNGENVPLGQLFVRARELDVIVAVDASADDGNQWPNGSSPLHTASRISSLLQASHQTFPPTPQTPEDWIVTGVNLRPTFFGCDPTSNPPVYPLVIYFPNSPPLSGDDPVTNTGTFKISYTPKFTQIFIDQAHNNTIGGFLPNSTSPDPNFGKCLQCAAVDRARLRVGLNGTAIDRSDLCTKCFEQYCYNPQDPPSKDEVTGRKLVFQDPDPQGTARVENFLAREKGAIGGGVAGLVVLTAGLIGFLIWWKKRKNARLSMGAYQTTNTNDDDEWLAKYGLSASELRPPKKSWFLKRRGVGVFGFNG